MARGNKLSLLTKEWRVVDGEKHRHCRLIDSNWWKWLRILNITDGIANLKLIQSYDSTDISTVNTLCTNMAHALESVKFLNFSLLHRTITMSYSYLHTILHLSTMNTAYGDTSLVA